MVIEALITNIISPILFVYLLVSLVKRTRATVFSQGNLDSIVLIIIYFVMSAIYAYLVLDTNNFISLSPGSDSDTYESILLNYSTYGYDQPMYRLLESQNKHFVTLLDNFYYSTISNTVLAGTFIVIVRLLCSVVAMITIYDLLIKNGIKLNRMKINILLFNTISIIVAISFLREAYIIFFITEILYVYATFKKSLTKHLIIIVLLLLLNSSREMYAWIIGLYIILEEYKTKRLMVVGALGFISIVMIFASSGQVFESIYRRLVIDLFYLADSDVDLIGANDHLLFSVGKLYNYTYSTTELLVVAINRIIYGLKSILIQPIFSSYLLHYMYSNEVLVGGYNGSYSKVLFLSYSAIYDFIIFPLFISFVANYKRIRYSSVELQLLQKYFILLALGTILLYSLKYFGSVHFRIYYLYHIFILTLSLTLPITRKYFIFGLFIMVSINILIFVIRISALI
jgi:hypothetical protein